MIDLHCHSHFSDGVLSPKDLLQKALQQKIICLALTDHDTLDGYAELQQAAVGELIAIIPGIELSTRWKKHDIHILGYGVQPLPVLQNIIAAQKASRITRAQQIGQRLEAVGVADAYNKACALAGHTLIGRPHFAQLLVNEGLTRDRQAGFRQFLGAGKSAYVATPWISMQEAVAGIKQALGQAVIAHPLKYALTRSKLHDLIRDFKEAGGDGLEVVSGEMTISQAREMAGTCGRFDLLASSGSDFHGDRLSRIGLGRQLSLPDNCQPIWHDWPMRAGV